MRIQFYKYQGTGNDFVMIDHRAFALTLSTEIVAQLCNRRFGIGADGLISLEKADGYDFKMVYYNSDGNLGSMCGNGGRCAVKFAYDLGIIQSETLFLASDGEHKATVKANGEISLKMIDVPKEKKEDGFFYNTGSPHLIVPVENLESLDVYKQGKQIRDS